MTDASLPIIVCASCVGGILTLGKKPQLLTQASMNGTERKQFVKDCYIDIILSTNFLLVLMFPNVLSLFLENIFSLFSEDVGSVYMRRENYRAIMRYICSDY